MVSGDGTGRGTDDGTVKVLDSGLAKTVERAGQAGGARQTATAQPAVPASPALTQSPADANSSVLLLPLPRLRLGVRGQAPLAEHRDSADEILVQREHLRVVGSNQLQEVLMRSRDTCAEFVTAAVEPFDQLLTNLAQFTLEFIVSLRRCVAVPPRGIPGARPFRRTASGMPPIPNPCPAHRRRR